MKAQPNNQLSPQELLERDQKLLKALCIDYTAVYYCNLAKNTMEPIKRSALSNGSVIDAAIPEHRYEYTFRIRYFYDKFVIKESAPDFLEKLSIPFLRAHLQTKERFAYRLRTIPNPAGQEYFEVQIVRVNADLDGFEIALGYRYIDDLVAEEQKRRQEELAYEKKLMAAVEDADRANAAKTDFLRRMSHDIRTPINGIRGLIDIANSFPNDLEKQKECRDKVYAASGYLLELVNNILDMNKLESGEVRLLSVPFEMNALFHEIDPVLQSQASENGVQLKTQSTVEPLYLIGSPVHIKQILINIASNALKYTPSGGTVSVQMQATKQDADMMSVTFCCADTGIGMSEQFLSHAFEPFTQENRSARTSYSGTGLGLSIVKKLVDQMGGSIQLSSKLGKGTIVTIHIPFQIDHSNHADSETDSSISLQGRHILLVEDNDLNLEIAQFMLENEGMTVSIARNGQQAVDTFVSSAPGTYDVILMDIMMPIMGGLEATRMIRASNHPDAKTIPIFAMTANAFTDDITRSKKAGMNEHLTKPLNAKSVIQMIRKYIGKKEAAVDASYEDSL